MQRTFYGVDGKTVVAVSTGKESPKKGGEAEENALKELSRKTVRPPIPRYLAHMSPEANTLTMTSLRIRSPLHTGGRRYSRAQGSALKALCDRPSPLSALGCRRLRPRVVRVEPQDDVGGQGEARTGAD